MRTNRRRFLATVGSAVPVVLAGCSGGGVESTVATVKLQDGHFSTCNAYVDKEGRVVWENESDVTHVVSSASDNWDFEATLKPGNGTQKKFGRSDVYVAQVSKKGSSSTNKMKIAVGDASIDKKIDSC